MGRESKSRLSQRIKIKSNSEAEPPSRFRSAQSPGEHLPSGENILLICLISLVISMQPPLLTTSHPLGVRHPSISIPLVHFIPLGEL